MAFRADRRSLVYAIGLSLGMHALLLALRWSAVDGAAHRGAPIVARLAPAEALAPSAPLIDIRRPKAKLARAGVPSVASKPAPPPLPAVEPAVDEATAIARYRYELIGTALRYKRYPGEAVAGGWEGEVLIRVAIAGSGAADVSVKTSSGQPLLDQEALTAFRAAAPLVPLPATLRGQPFGFEVRAVYSLRD